MVSGDRELSDLDGRFHPDEDTLHDYLAGGLSTKACAELERHITRCPNCTARLETLEQMIDGKTRKLELHYSRAREQARQRLALGGADALAAPGNPVRRLAETLIGSRIAWAMATGVVVFLCIGITWGPLGHRSTPATDDDLLPRGGGTAAHDVDRDVSSNAIEMLNEIGSYAQFPLERAVAYSIGLLNRMDVPLEMDSLSFEAATAYVSQVDDTWEGVAGATLGDQRLWPILVLLNPEEARLGELAPNSVLRIPDITGVP